MADLAPRTQIPLARGDSVTAAGVIWQGGSGTFSAEATWAAGSVTLQVLSGNNTWIPVGLSTTFTANGIAGFTLPKGMQIRAAIVTATAVYAYVTPF